MKSKIKLDFQYTSICPMGIPILMKTIFRNLNIIQNRNITMTYNGEYIYSKEQRLVWYTINYQFSGDMDEEYLIKKTISNYFLEFTKEQILAYREVPFKNTLDHLLLINNILQCMDCLIPIDRSLIYRELDYLIPNTILQLKKAEDLNSTLYQLLKPSRIRVDHFLNKTNKLLK